MKYLFGTLALVAAIAAAIGFLCFRATCDPAVEQALAKGNAMEWLRADFHLNDAQFAAIKRMHDSYSMVCEGHCRDIQEATRARDTLKASPSADPAALTTAERRLAELRSTCESAIATHVRQVAAEMSPASGQRYLALVLPKIKDFDHVAPPDVHLNRPHHH